MRLVAIGIVCCALAGGQTSYANDWEKFYRPVSNWTTAIPYDGTPEMMASVGNTDADLDQMWRRGFAPIGSTSFETGNNKTDDAVRFAKKLRARYLVVGTNLNSSHSVNMPLTLPNTTTSYTTGNATAYGNSGTVSGNYSGTTTNYGTQTTFIPITVNRFGKTAIYFKEVPKSGLGIFTRELTSEEMQRLGTRHAVGIRFIRDGSPAYSADLFPGDIITKINGQPADTDVLKSALTGPQPLIIQIDRKGQLKDISVNVPPEWQPK